MTIRPFSFLSPVFALSMLAFSACAGTDSAPDDESGVIGVSPDAEISDGAAITQGAIEWIHVDGSFSGDAGKTDSPGAGPAACECATSDCLVGLVQDNFGCDVCVVFDCPDSPRSACNACGDSSGPAPIGAGDGAIND